MSISAALVKELRDRTGSGMMECKKALQEADGDLERAVELMRKSGLAKADKKAGRTTAEGAVLTRLSDDGRRAAMVEINSETDFVAKSDDFQRFADAVVRRALDDAPADRDALLEMPLEADGQVIATSVKELVAKVGENIHIRRVVHYQSDGAIGAYVHGGRIGVLVELEGGDAELAKDLAMHIAASHPLYTSDGDVPADVIEQERQVIEAQSETSGKSPEIVEKMVQGRLKKYLAEITLLGQPFVKDPDTTVGKLLESSNARVLRFHRFEVGEGVEKKDDNFADEVMAQVRDSGQ